MKIELGTIIIDRVATTKDGSLKLTILTRELPGSEKIKILDAVNKQEVDLGITAIEEDPKSPAQVMRSIIYKIWETTTGKKQDFPSYYRSYMFRLNETLKERIQ